MIKRFFDIMISATFLLIFSPLLVLTALLLYFLQKGDVIYSQRRLGLNHNEFNIYKFCTMTNEVDGDNNLLPDIDRVTKIGDFLRRTSLDELPGFWNVFIGDMSIVGPRPLPVHYKDRYSYEQDKRHKVKSGVTGWAQVNGRNAISWDEKFQLDVWYVKNHSFWLDLRILFLTINYVLSRKDIVPYNEDSMEEFIGTNTKD